MILRVAILDKRNYGTICLMQGLLFFDNKISKCNIIFFYTDTSCSLNKNAIFSAEAGAEFSWFIIVFQFLCTYSCS